MDWPLAHQPLWIQITVPVVSLVCTRIAWRLIKRIIRTRLAAGDESARAARWLLIIAVPLVSVDVAAFMIGTLEGSVAFANHYLGWTNWRRYIPWGSLDAATIGFSLLAIRAVEVTRSPRAPMRVVFASAGMSMLVQLVEGGSKHTWQGGGFLGYLAIVMALILHTVIGQIRGKKADEIVEPRTRPAFGLRWFTAPPSTIAAFLAWINWPDERLDATVANALRHLADRRAVKRQDAFDRSAPVGLPTRWWVAPWKTARSIARRTEQLRTEHETAERTAQDTLRAERERSDEMLRIERANAEQRAADALAAHEATVARLIADHAATIESLRAEIADQRIVPLRTARSTTARSGAPRPRGGAERSNGAKLTDAEAVAALLRAHAGAEYDWSSREVNRITGAGFGRIPKLIAMVAEHHARARSGDDSDADAEREPVAVNG